ncbi:MAG: SDR family NAD(P)-dependent oxidoreductase [Bacteroidales bacterium]|nr:SDR family NAD(P)-dependent oxidoreductase [Bacteroidales bacterium]
MKKNVLITGASKGIGAACAKQFAKSGRYNVIITGRDVEALAKVEDYCKFWGAKVKTLCFDVRDFNKCKEAVASLKGRWAHIDVLINNAGLALGLDKEYEAKPEEWDTMIDTNIKGILNMTRLIVPKMVKYNSGDVINIGSLAGDYAYGGGGVYCATKAAVKALSDGLRIDVANTGVRVTTIKPGLVETNFSVTRFHGDKAKADNVYKGIKPLRAKDIASLCLFCAAVVPAHIQIAEILVTPTPQANSFVVSRE